MSNLATPAKFAVIALAAGLPLAAGLAVVAWSKVRAKAHAAKVADVDMRLGGLYRTVELREPPAHLAKVLDALEEQEALQAGVAAAAAEPPPRPIRQV